MAKETTESRNGSKLWNAQEARQVLSELESSGQSQNTFAQSKGVSRSRLQYWRKRLCEGQATDDRKFVPAVVAGSRPTALVEVRLLSGVVVTVREPAEVSTGWVCSLVQGLSQGKR